MLLNQLMLISSVYGLCAEVWRCWYNTLFSLVAYSLWFAVSWLSSE